MTAYRVSKRGRLTPHGGRGYVAGMDQGGGAPRAGGDTQSAAGLIIKQSILAGTLGFNSKHMKFFKIADMF